MGFKVVFLNTFPTPPQYECLLELFNALSWSVDCLEVLRGELKSFSQFDGNLVLISPEVQRPKIVPGEGYLKILLPLNCDLWRGVLELLGGSEGFYRTYRELETAAAGCAELETEAERFFLCEGEPPSPLVYKRPLAEEVGKLLLKKGLTLATAESCTGGLVASEIVSVPGSSAYFLGSIVAYSNEAKVNLLGVSEETLKKFGAVSEQTALEMAKGALERFKSSVAISTTGIAGPGGGGQKPVGLTYFALITPEGQKVFKKIFNFGRNQNRRAAAYFVLFELYKRLKGL